MFPDGFLGHDGMTSWGQSIIVQYGVEWLMLTRATGVSARTIDTRLDRIGDPIYVESIMLTAVPLSLLVLLDALPRPDTYPKLPHP